MLDADDLISGREPKHLSTSVSQLPWLEDQPELPAPILQLAPVLQVRAATRLTRLTPPAGGPILARSIEHRGRASSFFGTQRLTVLENPAGTWVVAPDIYVHISGPVSRGLRGSGKLQSGAAHAFAALKHESDWTPESYDWRQDATLLAAHAQPLLAALWFHPLETAQQVTLTARLTAVGARLVSEHSNNACSRQVRLPSTLLARARPVVLPDASAIEAETNHITARIPETMRPSREAGAHRAAR